MKKESKMLANAYHSRGLDKQNSKAPLMHEERCLVSPRQQSKHVNTNCKDIMFSSPNKENQLSSSNQQRNMLSPVSPLQMNLNSPNKNFNTFNSPVRTTPLQNLSSMRSNKGKQPLQVQPESNVMFSGFSKDGKYKIQSHCLQAEELKQACQFEKKTNLGVIMQSRRQGNQEKIPHIQPAKTSHKQNGVVKSYAVNTHQGVARNYNQDRVSITLNIKKKGVKAHFFAIYDGHGGNLCCEFLKDHFHEQLINSSAFPSDPRKALGETIKNLETEFLQHARANGKAPGMPDKSGSCAIIALLVQDVVYIANVGDSRAIMSTEKGKMAYNLSKDHRPSEPREQQRILTAGGKIYRTQMTRTMSQKDKAEKVIGPLRIFPGKLSVSRTIGDIEAKDPQFGGNPGVVSGEPEIRKFKLTGKQDFIILCCDGILERLESMQVVDCVWRAVLKGGSLHEKAGNAVDNMLIQSMRRKSTDNLTAIVICLSELKDTVRTIKAT